MPPSPRPPDPAENAAVAVASLASELRAFVKDSEDHRSRIERDQSAIWAEIKEQGRRFADAVDRISTRGAITWPVICTTIGVMLGLIGAASTIGHAYVENRIHQLEIIDTQSVRESDQVLKRLEKLEDARIRDLEKLRP